MQALVHLHRALGWLGRSIFGILGLKFLTDVVILLGR